MKLHSGEQLGPFEVVSPVGNGGMGEVYRARDPRLGRDVALKVVRGDPGHEASERLRREARVAASFSHPNLCTIFEIGERNGELWLAMELLEGESLESRLARGALAVGEAVDRTLEILAGLEALHARGVVHRDLKPSNVFLTPHGAKLLDFGLAAPMDRGADAESRLTRADAVVGTPLYLAPELWRGAAATPASDLFAVGALLYEAVAGRPPFRGATTIELYEAIARAEPPALVGGEGVESLDRLVGRALAKEPEARFASAGAFARGLAGWRNGTLAEGPAVRVVRRLVVVPFRLLRPDRELDFLGGALAESIALSLGGLDGLAVRSARWQEGGEAAYLPALARERSTDVALCGSLLAAGGRVRLTAELVEVADGTVRWSGFAEAATGDLFELVDGLARQTVDALRLPLGARLDAELEVERPRDGAAFELYLRAIDLGRSALDGENLRRSRELLVDCLARDPRFAPGWARLGRVHRVLAKYGHAPADECRREAHAAFDRALALAPDSPLVHHLFTPFELEELAAPVDAMLRLLARVGSRRADANLYGGLVAACRYCGLLEESLAAEERARRLDPGVETSVAYTWWMAGDPARALDLDREAAGFIRLYAMPLVGRVEEAVAGYERWERSAVGLESALAESSLGALRGDPERALAGAHRMIRGGFSDPEGLYFLVRNLSRAGLADEALDLLERVIDGGFTVPRILAADPWLDRLRGERRFATALVRAETIATRAGRRFVEAGGPRLLGLSEPTQRLAVSGGGSAPRTTPEGGRDAGASR